VNDTDATSDPHLEATRRYYDEFATRYDDARGGRVPGGYHDLIDELELAFLARHGRGKSLLEVGCGTGLLLERMAAFASEAEGVDLSPGMLDKARARGLTVREGSATALPYEDDRFDVSCSFKVLAHIEQIRAALSEMIRVVRPGGLALAEFYNPWSLRALAKRLGPAGAISDRTREDAVHTRFDSPRDVEALLPPGTTIVDSRGVRIVTPAARVLRWPVVGSALIAAERRLCDGPLARFGGFWIAAIQKPG